jgi:hypothetical protein
MQMGIHFEFKGLIWIPAFAGMTGVIFSDAMVSLRLGLRPL